MKSRYGLLFALLYSTFGFAQKPAEISIISDNDLYTSPINDQYYTNGIELIYRYLGNSKNENVAKKITEFRLGQYIYNPQSVRAADINVNDRPFAGYLFAEAGINTFYKNESVLKLNFQGGVVGPESYAEQLQRGLHKIIGYPTVQGWQYQITTTIAAQAQAVYSHKILSGRFHENVDFHVQGELNVGTIWMGASVGPMMRISLKRELLPMYDSALHGAALNIDKELSRQQRELFLYINPVLNYQNYDATILGSMFNNNSPVTFPLIPFRFNAEAGVKYRYNNWTYSYSFNYRSKELTNRVITGYYYGSIVLSYRL
ncbi:hypothetical protein Q765_18990 [Flavobacterium rivuli WB 3.3-2 = DSM 21788]|uniref:Outer membrane protein n=1 Tax=Flavobacterium rivuli WB 3.3-2 = DSM 21788 TaxID=1121895 RepID=A0A0A2LX11_9FLAO|nr:lipid A deacylase LpxR family protein [Flavobacterium rivuli]KGO84917.1 hypothetical protein Q765_18990 [Flavobacterium rivuli WB 3.3-2 = DSM 21788]